MEIILRAHSATTKWMLFLALMLMSGSVVFGQAPTEPSKNLTVSNLDGDRFYISFTRGNGSRRIIVAGTNPVSAVPVDGADYLAGNFGQGNEIAPGEFVVYNGNANQTWLYGFNHSTTYHLKIVEYNGANFSTVYLKNQFLEGTATTLTAPTVQGSGLSFSQVTGSGMTVNWTNGNGTGRVLIAKADGPVDVEPQDLTSYSGGTAPFANGTNLGNGNFVQYSGAGNSKAISGLDPNRTYHFALFEYNGSSGRVYLRPGTRSAQSTVSTPTVPATNFTVSTANVDGDRFYYSYTNGNGASRMVIAKKGSPVTFVPQDGASYAGNINFGSGTEVSSDEFVVYNGTSNANWLYNLEPSTTYHLAVFEYNGAGTNTYYLRDPFLTGQRATLSPPTVQASNLVFSNISGNSMTIGWTNGNGTGRVLVGKEGAPVDASPADFGNYGGGSGSFTNGSNLGNGNFVQYSGGGNNTTITGLSPAKTYHFEVFEYTGSGSGRQYLRPGAKGAASTVATPTIPSSNFSVNNVNVDGDRFYYSFTSGNGSRRIVVAKKGSAVTYRPVDGKVFTASTTFAQGEEVAAGEFVVYSGNSNGSWLYGLDPSSTYHLAIFEYNGTGEETFYLRDPFLTGERATLFPPTIQAGNLNFTNVTGNSMTVNWTNGDGTGRVLVGKANAPVDAAPADFTNYSGAGSFTNGSNLGEGNYVQYSGSGRSVNITGLSPNVTYHFELFEYTGSSSGRQYLKPGTKALQTTGAAPTIASSMFTVNNANVDGDRFYYSFTVGDGARRVVIAKKGSPVTFRPTNGQVFTGSTTFGSGTEVAPGEFAIYDGTSNGSWLYGLEPATEYHLAIFEYNGTGENTYYLRDLYLAASKPTLSPPSIQSSNAFTSSRSNNSINISWTRGDGANRILIGRKEGPVNVEPTDLANYTASSMFGVRQVGTGNYVLYSGSGNNINVTNLEPGTNYHFALFEFNGSSARLYLRPGYSFALETFGERPSVQVTNASYSNVDFTGMDVDFSKGNGTRRLVLARAGSAVNAGPADFTAYSASATFGQGDQIGSGNFVVYNGTEEGFTLEGLEPGVTYHFAFYEYATSEQGDLYLAPPYTSSQSSKTSADIGVTGITSPVSSCELGDAETVSIEITNFNSAPIGPFQVAYSLNGAAPVIERISGTNTIAGNGKLSYTFQTKVDLSAEGNHELIAYTILEGDSNPSNDRFEISINSSAESDANVSPDVTICRGTPALLQASGGTSYRWSTGATTNLLEVAPLVSTEYRVTITTSNGCQIEKRVWVNVEEPGELPVISSEPDPESCEGGRVFSTQLDIPVRWYLDVDAEIFDLGESITLKSDRSGNFIARYLNESGCEISSSPLLVEATELPVLTVSGLTTICTGESLTLSVSGLRELVWSTGESGESITVSPTGDTKYWVSGKYNADCHFSDTLEINVIPATAPDPVRQMLPANGSLNLPQPISLSWTPGANSLVYDVFVWEEGSEKPSQPVAADIPQISYTARNLERGKAYLWQIHAKNSCFVTEGPVQRFVAAGLPDLLIQSHVAPEAVVAGNTLTVSWEVKNVGAGNTNNTRWKDRIWLSADLDLRKADDILLGTFDNPSSLMAGESYTMTQEVRVPINLRGVYYLFIITDNDDGYCTIENGVCANERRSHTQTVSESDEQNNLIYQPISIGIPPLADLKVNQVGVTTDAFSGDSISVLYEVQNIGERDAKGLFWRFKRDNGQYSYSTGNTGGTFGGGNTVSAGSAPANVSLTESCRIEYYWRDAIYLSQEPEFNISKSTKIEEYSVFLAEEDSNSSCITGGDVAVNATYTQQREMKLPDNVFGTYYVYIVSNFSGMFENDYSNNVRRSDPINVILRPPSDLEVADLQVPAEVIAGTNMKVSWTVENIGANPPNVSSWVDEVFISDQPDFDRSKAISIFRKTFTTPRSFNEFGSSTPVPLETGDRYSAEAEALVPERLSGDYYVYLLTDSDNRVFEFDSKSNNVKRSTDTIKLITGERAELTPVSISFPDTVYREAAFPLKWRIRNSGTKAAVGFTDRVYWSVSPNPAQQPITSMGSILHGDSLPAGQAVERALLVNLPKNAPDSIYFHVFTDVFDNLFEVDETNNRASNQALGVHSPVVLSREVELVARQSDLAATDLVVSNSSIGSGELLNINFTVENLGPDDVTDAFVTRVYLAKSSVLTEDDHYLTEFGRARLAVGDQYATGRAVKIPEWASGEYFVYLWVDYRGAVTEDQDKTNNIAVRKITVTPTPAPDLQITALSAPSEVISGEAFYVTYTLENKGEGSTRADWNDGFFLSTSPSLGTGAQNIGFKNVSVALAKGESLTDSALVKAPSNFSGNYFLIAKADYQNRVFEGLNGAELNNERNQVLLVTISDPTDLEVSSFSTPESAYLGDETSAEIEVTNVGEKPASGRLFNGFYLSPDNQFDGAADPLVGTQDADVTILPGQSRTFTLKGPILDLAPGDYLGIGRTNLLASINEVNYQNNLMVADRALSLDVRSLPLDVPTSASLTAGTWRYYKVNVNANLDLLIDLSSNRTVGSNDVFVSFGKVPTPNEFDYQGILKNRTDQRVLIPETKSGTYYILVKTDIPLGQQVELLARALPFSILSSNPGAVGNGTVTTTLTGAGFKAGMEVSLLKNGAKVAGATHVNLTNSMSGSLTWRLGDVPFGVYDVEVKNPDGSRVTLANGLEVEPSTGYGGLRYDILAPDVVRRGKTAFYNVVFRNEGNVDVPYVLAELAMEDDIVIYELKTQGKLKTNSTIDPLGRLADQPDYGFANGFLVVPLYGRDLRPGEEFSASLLLGNFTGSTFPMQVKSAGVSSSVLVLI